jgi:hypothetical protein
MPGRAALLYSNRDAIAPALPGASPRRIPDSANFSKTGLKSASFSLSR